jgi:membrane-bound lytic murein transglycosylase A
MRWRRPVFAAFAAAVALAGCATTPRAPTVSPQTLPPPQPPHLEPGPGPAGTVANLSALPGWEAEDHLAALSAFQAGCGASRDIAMAIICGEARALGPIDAAQAKAFLEANLRPEPVAGTGLLTAYFTPIYEARQRRSGDFTAPVRPRPVDLPAADVGGVVGAPYPDRAAIEARPTGDAVAWMRPEELFFLQIQGSGVLVFDDGTRAKAVFDGSNGAPFRGIATPMRQMGLLADSGASGESIRAWLADHRGAPAAAVMQLDPRYVFFRLVPDDGADPAGAAGVRLAAGRAVAIDPAWHDLGEVLWVDGSAPALSGAFPAYRRLVLALDTGGAIKGDVRADLYLGRGPAAGLEAGRVRHALRLYRLVPMPRDGS